METKDSSDRTMRDYIRRDNSNQDSNGSKNIEADIPVTIFVKSARGSEVASKLAGYFMVKGMQFKFTAVAFGRIGGHNVSVNISKAAAEKIRKMGVDPDRLQLLMQRKLVEGDVVLPDNIKPPE